MTPVERLLAKWPAREGHPTFVVIREKDVGGLHFVRSPWYKDVKRRFPVFSVYRMTAQRAIDILQECERKLRELASQAVAAGDYETVIRLSNWARTIAALPSQNSTLASDADHPNGRQNNDPSGSARPASRSPSSVRRSAGRARQPRRRKKPRASAYPMFVRSGDDLIKIGWSKKAKKEYQHKSPQEVVYLLLKRLLQVGASGDVFTTEELLPLQYDDASDVPSYQAYLSLAWFRKEQLVVQHGRQGYSLLSDTDLRDAVQERWKLLPQS